MTVPKRPNFIIEGATLVDPKKLTVPYDLYQRDSRKFVSRVNKIADGWDWYSASAILTSKRNKKIYVVDGGTRVNAALKIGVDEMWAVVFLGLTAKQEAHIFLSQRFTKAIGPIDNHNALLFYGDENAIFIRDAIEKYGLKIASGKGDNNFGAPGTLQSWLEVSPTSGTHHNLTKDKFIMILDFLYQTWGLKGKSKTSNFLWAARWFILGCLRNGIPVSTAVEKMSKFSPVELSQEAKAITVETGIAGHSAYAYAMEAAFNKGKHYKNKIKIIKRSNKA